MRLALLLLCAAVALAGCSVFPVSEASQTHDNTTSASPAPTTPTTTSLTLPPRPRELPLDKVNPCTILTKQQRTQLSLDTTPTPYTDTELKARACTIRGTYSGQVARLALVTNEGAELWISDEAQNTAKVISVIGFPALEVRTPNLDTLCNVEVDVAQGEFLDVLFRDGGSATPIPQDDLCLGAQRVAEAAMNSLSTGH
ncbi:DUF3558 domain-containing protein [Kutzneria buriramensis]|uniref:Uncharacterized protein DUF3558 n=1 Tax=Kutzneria buriramensis TaxID=1045776 RepID=A0A3E0IAH7_9PSEU|nr:DUF3558 domain-containing protein [Kutzneria buriramensis]REH55744.1 uncharacterized protein DUF3558 [Kutzneria buriramensis]